MFWYGKQFYNDCILDLWPKEFTQYQARFNKTHSNDVKRKENESHRQWIICLCKTKRWSYFNKNKNYRSFFSISRPVGLKNCGRRMLWLSPFDASHFYCLAIVELWKYVNAPRCLQFPIWKRQFFDVWRHVVFNFNAMQNILKPQKMGYSDPLVRKINSLNAKRLVLILVYWLSDSDSEMLFIVYSHRSDERKWETK